MEAVTTLGKAYLGAGEPDHWRVIGARVLDEAGESAAEQLQHDSESLRTKIVAMGVPEREATSVLRSVTTFVMARS